MSGDLAVAMAVFLVSAGSVIFFGMRLAVYGDALATLTGWGRLFVGSVLVALATSLPELSTNISAVRLEPPNPALAVGNVLGANMLNMFNLSLVVLIFGGKRFLQQVAPEQGYLAVLAILMTGLAVLFGAIKMDISFWQIGLSSLILIMVFLAGMRVVYTTRPQEQEEDERQADGPGMTLRRAWLLFLGVSAGVVVAGFFLAWSADQIAEITGVASSTLGILAVSFVTTMPEMSSAIAAARIGAADLGVAGLFGSNAFNVSILFYVDPFYREGILGNQTDPAHFIAGGVAVGLMLAALALIVWRDRIKAKVVGAAFVLIIAMYIAGAVTVATVGATEEDDGKEAASAQSSVLRRLARWSSAPRP
jgi:cation:H+ antiporter